MIEYIEKIKDKVTRILLQKEDLPVLSRFNFKFKSLEYVGVRMSDGLTSEEAEMLSSLIMDNASILKYLYFWGDILGVPPPQNLILKCELPKLEKLDVEGFTAAIPSIVHVAPNLKVQVAYFIPSNVLK